MVPGESKQLVAVPSMCATAANTTDVPMVSCIIRDMSSGQLTNQKAKLNFPVSTTAYQLMQEVAKKFCYEPHTFELIFQQFVENVKVHFQVNVDQHNEETLEELGFRCGENERNNLLITAKKSMTPKKVDTSTSAYLLALKEAKASNSEEAISEATVPNIEDDHVTKNERNSPHIHFDSKVIRDIDKREDRARNHTPDFSYSYAQAAAQPETGFVGLVNQAMTCYLNSLLQTLFMTPEFRNALYRWEFDGTEEEGTKSIPFQLQKLFLQLQTSKRPAVGTTELTTSFGWDSSEAWQQHDVQELCRVMFDALEQKFKNTEQADLISTLYEGKLKDYVKCLECNYESAREDTFLDVPLVVRPFGSSQAYPSVDEALQAFVTPEILQGSNQYYCEHCAKKCDAHKGLKFSCFPYLLTLQLKRFDFDPQSMHRIKLNDRVSFPEILNLNQFMKSENTESSPEEEGDITPESMDDDEGIDVDSHSEPSEELCTKEINSKKAAEKGPYMYELFSIMVHSGSANGGHYYAYIKSFKLGEWFCFNDAQVTQITEDDIQKTYGGGPTRGYYSSAYSSSTNAYMLMYRQINKEKNSECMIPETFPEHIKVLLQCMQEQEERERVQKELDRSSCTIKLFCQHPVRKRLVEMKLKVHKDCTLAESTAVAHSLMNLQDVVPLECCRLVRYDEFSDSLERSFEGCDHHPMEEILLGVRSSYKFDLFLEIRKPQEVFQDYKPGGTTIKVHVVDLEKEEVAIHPLTIRCHPSNTVQELKAQIAESLDLPSNSEMRIVQELYSNEYNLLRDPLKTLTSEGFKKSNKIFVEYQDPVDAQKPYIESKLFKVLDCYAHTICIHIVLPKVDKASLERLRLYNDNSDEGKDSLSSDEEAETESISLPEDDHEKHSIQYPLNQDFNCSDQSEDSSSERTLVGEELSPRNNSPDPEAKPECENQFWFGVQTSNLSSPEENGEQVTSSAEPEDLIKNEPEIMKRYFRAWPYPYTECETKEQMLRVYVDKRMTLLELKKELEPYITLKSDYFKIFKVYSNSQEFECTKLAENLMTFCDDSKLTVKLGRALRKGEYKVKIYQFCVNEPETSKFLLDWVIVKGMTVLKLKKEILPQLKESCNLDIPLNRCRLRKKSWKNPGSIYFNNKRFQKDISVNTNWEIFLEVLPDAEPVTSPDQFTLFTRRWHPAVYKLDPFQEIVLDDVAPQTLMKKLYELSGIPEEDIEVAKCPGGFPSETSILSIHKELEWIALSSCLDSASLSIGGYKTILFYRDKKEELKKLTEEEKWEILNKESNKSNKIKLKNYYSPKKEKALKIYTMDSTPSSNDKSQKSSQIVPDLD